MLRLAAVVIMLTRDETFLQPYFGSKRSTDSVFKAASRLLHNDKEQLARLQNVKNKIEVKYQYVDYFLKYLNKA